MKRLIYGIIGLALAMTAGFLLTSYRHVVKEPVKVNQTKKEKVSGTIRVGYFPNITHSQALVGLSKGTFAKSLGKDVTIETKVFNAGPSEIEALYAGEIDLGYIGPNPAINGYIKSKGEALRVIAGATSGGAVFVVRKDAGIEKPEDLAGKKLATPQLGNTQDVALRNYLRKNDLKLKTKGGTVDVQPVENPDILTLFVKKELDGAWVPEPWGARLVKEGGGEIFIDERKLWPKGRFVTANIIVRTEFLEEHPELVERWLAGHVETTEWINSNNSEARTLLNEEIKKLTGKSLADDVLADAFSRLKVTYDPIQSSLFESAEAAYNLGFIKEKNLKNIYDLELLNRVLKEKGLPAVNEVNQGK